MRLRNVTGSREMIAANEFVIQNPGEWKGKWKDIFQNENPIRLEIGMGKGRFLITLARQNPSVNYLGIEKYSTVLLRALQKMEEEPLPNIRFIRMDAEEITEVFAQGEIDRIYLNFSDPWPKDRHAKRRLPSRQFLERYDQILKSDGTLEFKTDNKDLFTFAEEEVADTKWAIRSISYDLHADASMMEGNVMTEYEEKFSAMGNPIYKYVIYRR
ncbi:MAG TPA: tRNA (guanosine(46)-N7)-methyltransferase TrmB [Lachnospiraceae bacterium]|nr:tRNA (guanosine(46)-N7)-methyltransferase TrmB [Lachnospiraceae bacterium]HPF28693.1 tRNA (guanosine(46)-N7)-methyltransferase TrmB [Lachnospiraceae bacterium]